MLLGFFGGLEGVEGGIRGDRGLGGWGWFWGMWWGGVRGLGIGGRERFSELE